MATLNGGDWSLSAQSPDNFSMKETPEFTEPGLFLVRRDGNMYYEAINSMPFGRPKFDELLGALDFVLTQQYPARGEA